MTLHLDFEHLLEYTAWERSLWREWLRAKGASVLAISAGPHGDGRFQTIGDLVRHIFSAEQRYVQRLEDRALTDPSSVPNNDIDALFRYGDQSRADLRSLLAALPAELWDAPRDFKILDFSIRATPRKIVTHVLTHEIRHWAQIGTMLRLQGLTGEFHDLLFSPVMGEHRMQQQHG